MRGVSSWREVLYYTSLDDADATRMWRSWPLSEVLYRGDDVVSHVLALLSLLPLVLVVFLAGMASAPSPRRLPTLVLLMFLVCNVAVNATLKALLRSPRPTHPAVRDTRGYSTTHGMPSDHAQFMYFFVSYLLLRRPRTTATTRAKAAAAALPLPPPRVSSAMTSFLLLAATLVAAGRVYNGYHTVHQVLVGAVVGAGVAYAATRAPLQHAMLRVVQVCVVPVMHFCTAWTRHVV